MPWGNDRGRHGIICFVCRGKGILLGLHLATGTRQVFQCRDCEGAGFVKQCVACRGTGQLDAGTDDGTLIDCPECSGKGYPLPKRIQVQTHGLRSDG